MFFGAPLWVWGILAYLIIVGILAMKPRTLSLQTLFIAPVIFTLLKYKTLYEFWYVYVPVFLVSILPGLYVVSHEKFIIDVDKKSVRLPGSYTLLPLFLLFFASKFVLGYFKQTDIAQLAFYDKVDIVISAAFSGYLFGKAIYILHAYYKKK